MKKRRHKTYIYIIGWIGTTLILIAYGFNSFGYLESTGLIYPTLNLIGAILLGLRVYADRNWSDIALELFFGGVAFVALIKYFLF